MNLTIQIVAASETGQGELTRFFRDRGYRVFFAASGKKALQQIKKEKPDLLFMSLDLSDFRGIDFLKKVKKNGEDIPVFTLVDSKEQGIETMKWGAEYYFCNPCNIGEVTIVLQRLLATWHYRERVERLRCWFLQQLEKNRMVLASKNMKELYQQALKVAEEGNTPILLVGEVGTGKEFLARIIHLKSPHFIFPFISVECSDRKTALIDNHLGGGQKIGGGRKKGKESFVLPEGGTLFLHAIEYLPKSEQAKLVRYLKNNKIKRGKGADGSITGLRIMVSTSANLKVLVDKGKFNKELYQMLSKRLIQIPPLKKRSGEIIPLAMHFIKKFSREYGKQVKGIEPEVKQYLESYDWPGNVSELKNVIEHGVINAKGENISMKEMEFKSGNRIMSLDTLLMNGSFLSLDEMVALYVKTVLKKVKGNKSKAAKLLRVSRNTLKKKSVVI